MIFPDAKSHTDCREGITELISASRLRVSCIGDFSIRETMRTGLFRKCGYIL